MPEIPVHVVYSKTRLEEIDIRLSENIQRKDYNIIELAQWVFERKSA